MVEKVGPSLLLAASFTLSGIGIQACLPAPVERWWSARLGIGFLSGAAWLGLGLWASGFLMGVPVSSASAIVWLSIPVVAGVVSTAIDRSGRGLAARPTGRPHGRLWLGAAALVIASATGSMLASAGAEPVHDFDGWMTWGTQARYIQASSSVLPTALLDSDAFVIHPRYPILLPILRAATADLTRTPIDAYSVRPIYLLFYPAFVAALLPALLRAGGARGAAWAIVVLFGAPFVRMAREGSPFGTYSDFPLAAFLGCALVVLMHPRARCESWRGWLAGLFLAAAAGSKNEGMIAAAILLGSALAVGSAGGWRRAWRSRVRSGAVLALVAGGILAWKSRIPFRNEDAYLDWLSPADLVRGLAGRAPHLIGQLARISLRPDAWGYLFWVAPLVVVAGWRGLGRRAARTSMLLIVGQILVAFAAYSVVPDLGIVETTWNRFLIQMSGPLAIVLASTLSATLVTTSEIVTRPRWRSGRDIR
jgi:hypothetical protein